MRKFLIFFSLVFIEFNGIGQVPAIQWSKCFGDSLNQWNWSSTHSLDSSYISVGLTSEVNRSNKPYINKIDKFGNEVWNKKLNYPLAYLYTDIMQTSSGELFALAAIQGSTFISDMIFCKLNNNGDTIFTKYFYGLNGLKLKETAKGDILIVGSIEKPLHDLDLSIHLISKNGILKWAKYFGGSYDDIGVNVVELNDGSFTICGRTNSNDGDIVGFHNTTNNSTDAWLINVDSLGNKRWQKTIGGYANDEFTNLIYNNDNTYWGLITTNSFDGDVNGNHGVQDSIWQNNPYDVFVVKLDSNGNILKKKCFGGSLYDQSVSFLKENNNELVILSHLFFTIDGDHSGYSLNRRKQYAWLFKTDSNLNIIWRKYFGGVFDTCGNIQLTRLYKDLENNYIVSGSASSNGDDITNWHQGFSYYSPILGPPWNDFWLVKLTSAINLPFKIESFDAIFDKQDKVILQWKTANEVNVSQFNIQRSNNAKDFTSIGSVNASCCSYEFIDGQLLTVNNQLFYRLEMLDKDGSKKYSTIQQIIIKPQTTKILVYPNPAKDHLTVECAGAKELLMIDNLGRTVYRKMVNTQMTIIYTKQFPKGIYTVHIILNNGEIKNEKLIVE